MTELLDRSIAALRSAHDELEKLVGELGAEKLRGDSGAAKWSVAQVLSHLGSGAEISRVPLATAVSAEPAETDNQAVWARWDDASPEEQAAWFVEHDEAYVALLEGLSPEQRESLQIDMGFLPEPVGLEVAVGMRLNEVVAHSWDARVGSDQWATIDGGSATLVAEHFAGPLGFLLGFTTKPDQLGTPATVKLDGFSIVVEDSVRIDAGSPLAPTATFEGQLEAAVRLLTGRLRPEFTPEGVEVKGNISLDDLRRVFPGY